MAAVIGDLVSDPSHFHTMIATPAIQHQHSHQSSHYQTASSRPHHQPRQSSGSISRRYREDSTASVPRYPKHSAWDPSPATAAPPVETSPDQSTVHAPRSSSSSLVSIASSSSRLPSPPSSEERGTPRPSSSIADSQDASTPAWMASSNRGDGAMVSDSSRPRVAAPAATEPASMPQQQPSPALDPGASPRLPTHTINVRDLAHIQSLARAELVTGTGTGILDDQPSAGVRYEISGMPIGDIIEMVAALLHKITAANDLQHDAKQRNVAHQQQAILGGDHSSSSPMSTSVLAFHGKNVPAISILSYLSRIHKYCPTTYEVFLSLLVYFDRMTERVNHLVNESETRKERARAAKSDDADMKDSGILAEGSDLADDDDIRMEDDKMSRGFGAANAGLSSLATYFVVDSFNIHRLIIAGVTCASKFFSDVFYTNSRYAKVGGLPLAELNHLELQFLILNDFRLHVDVETLEAYATMLVEFYAREIVAHRSGPVAGME